MDVGTPSARVIATPLPPGPGPEAKCGEANDR
jgi:hypothetical protein